MPELQISAAKCERQTHRLYASVRHCFSTCIERLAYSLQWESAACLMPLTSHLSIFIYMFSICSRFTKLNSASKYKQANLNNSTSRASNRRHARTHACKCAVALLIIDEPAPFSQFVLLLLLASACVCVCTL